MSLPDTMRHVAVPQPGPPSVMTMARGPLPRPNAGEVLIEVAYAGVNRPDCSQRAGTYPPPPDASPILGLEVTGKVVARGSGSSAWNVGDEVCALVPGGGYAEYCTTPADWCLPVPTGFTLEQAAGLPENYFTVWNNVFERAHLSRGETFLVHGGTSGIGLAAIQLAKAFGATVFTTAGSAEKVAFCRSIGADHAIDYKKQDFAEEVKRLAKGGIDVILDMVGGDYVERNLKCLALEGRLAQIAFLKADRRGLDRLPGDLEARLMTQAAGWSVTSSRPNPVTDIGTARRTRLAAPRTEPGAGTARRWFSMSATGWYVAAALAIAFAVFRTDAPLTRVPITAEARPSARCPSAIFSLVASAWTSTMIAWTVAPSAYLASSPSRARNGSS